MEYAIVYTNDVSVVGNFYGKEVVRAREIRWGSTSTRLFVLSFVGIVYMGVKSITKSLVELNHVSGQETCGNPDTSLRCWKCRLFGHRAKNY